jgi:hypothetical protein
VLDHNALGLSCGSRGVDHVGQIVGCHPADYILCTLLARRSVGYAGSRGT